MLMSIKSIGIGELIVSNDRDDTVKTYSLGSCIAVIVYDSRSCAGGIVHVALPDSSIDREHDKKPVGYYADKAIPVLIAEMKRLGSLLKNVSIKLVGASDSKFENDRFKIGRRNIVAVKKLLWKEGLGVVAEDTGGTVARTVELAIKDGTIAVSSNGNKWTV